MWNGNGMGEEDVEFGFALGLRWFWRTRAGREDRFGIPSSLAKKLPPFCKEFLEYHMCL